MGARLSNFAAAAADLCNFCTAGKSNAMSTAMIAITTSNSISVNPRARTGEAGFHRALL
jgi:hypothetical protein